MAWPKGRRRRPRAASTCRRPGCTGRSTSCPSNSSSQDTHDEVYWELEKFLRLALKANPNVLETLWTPLVLHADELAHELRAMRAAFLSQHLYKTYSGYVLSQFRRMANAHEKTATYKPKHAMHLIRLLYSGIEALRTGEIRIDVAEHRDELLAIKRGELPFEQAKQQALELDREFQEAFRAHAACPSSPISPASMSS